MAGPKEYKVGYGRPPEHSRFKKGQSGNPKGRKPGSQNVASALARALQERVIITQQGTKRSVTKLEAIALQLVNKAASGDLRAIHQVAALSRVVEGEDPMEALQAFSPESDRQVLQNLLRRAMQPTPQPELEEPHA